MPDDILTFHLSHLRAALAAAGEPLSQEDGEVALAEGMALLAALTPPGAVAVSPVPAFGFDELCRIDDVGVQAVVRNVPFEVLSLALVEGREPIIRLFQRNLARRRAALLTEEITRLRGVAPPQAISEARAHVVRTAVDLAASGQIVISEGDDVETKDDLVAEWNRQTH